MPLKTHRDEQPTLNLTPMIDVVFLLIIFFMVATKFSEMERSIGVQVPEVAQPGPLTPAPEKQTVNVLANGEIELGTRIVTLTELQHDLANKKEQFAELGVVVRGDAECQFQVVADVFAACQAAGISEVEMAVRLAHRVPGSIR